MSAHDQCAQLARRTAVRLDTEDASNGRCARFPRWCEEHWRLDTEEFPAALEQGLSDAVTEQAVAADAHEARGENVL